MMLKRLAFPVFLLFAFLFVFPAFAAGISVGDDMLYDETRNRTIPVRIYLPQPLKGPAPIIIYSPSLGGSAGDAAYIGEALAANGYIGFFVEHPGSGTDVWEGLKELRDIKLRLYQSTKERANTLNRYIDTIFVINEIIRLNTDKDSFLKGKIDLQKIGMIGHAYGARNVLIAAGEYRNSLDGDPYKDPRIRAGVTLSPSLPPGYTAASEGELTSLYRKIETPIFHITGTNDENPFQSRFSPEDRLLPYKYIKSQHQYLLVLDGAEHYTFADTPFQKSRTLDAPIQKKVTDGIVLFFDSYLKRDETSLNELRAGYPRKLGPGDDFQFK